MRELASGETRDEVRIAANDQEMHMAKKTESENLTPEAQLEAFLARFDAKEQKLIRSVRTALKKRFPTANELAYDYADSVVIAYSPTENGIDGVVSFAARADGLRLYFMNGPKLADPKKLLQGTAKQVRFVALESARQVAHPDVEALIAAAEGLAKVAMPKQGQGALFVKGAAAKPKAKKKPAK